MAKSRSRTGRDASAIASRPRTTAPVDRLLGFTPGLPSLTAALSLLQLLEDRRQWHPEGRNRPARALVRSAARVVPSTSFRAAVPVSVRFAEPSRVAVCIRREQRREVLHAKGKAGGSPRRFRRRRRSAYSGISCRRK